VELILCYIALLICVPVYAKKKGYPPLDYLILSMVMTPVIVLFILVFFRKKLPAATGAVALENAGNAMFSPVAEASDVSPTVNPSLSGSGEALTGNRNINPGNVEGI
jgi:hypothetical protein